MPYMREWYLKNRERILKANKEKRKANPNVHYFELIKRLYGVTPDAYQQMLLDYKNACAICLVPQVQLKRRLVIDHDHTTGAVRGLLCTGCNRGLGLIKEVNLDRAVKYVYRP